MLDAYNAHVAERAALGIPALPLTKDQTAELVDTDLTDEVKLRLVLARKKALEAYERKWG